MIKHNCFLRQPLKRATHIQSDVLFGIPALILSAIVVEFTTAVPLGSARCCDQSLCIRLGMDFYCEVISCSNAAWRVNNHSVARVIALGVERLLDAKWAQVL